MGNTIYKNIKEYKKGNKDTVQKLLKDVLKWYEKNYLEIASNNNDNL